MILPTPPDSGVPGGGPGGGETPGIEAVGLSKAFPGVTALDDVSAAFRPGEIHALVGQNGAGKSTLINLFAGMLRPDAGAIRIGGRPAELGSTHEAIALGIATVYQELSLLPNLTVAQNIALGREPRRGGLGGVLLDVVTLRRRAAAALARVGAQGIAPDRRVAELSVAERQLVEIAKALSRDPSVLILDEPTAPLAQREAAHLFGIVRELRDQGLTILFVSHRFREILDHCDRATILRNGRKVATTGLEGWTEADLTEAMVGRRVERYARGREPAEAAPAAPLLTASGLRHGRQVRGVDLAVGAGEILGITGLLGAGQAEIARLLGGALRREGGTIAVAGRPVAADGPRAAIAAGICLLTDDRKAEGILPNLSLEENVVLPSLARRRRAGGLVERGAERAQVRAALDRFGVVARSPRAAMRTLSGGNQQKALIARWHLAAARILVMIEPTRGVDVGARAEIYRQLEAVAATGRAVVVVSSDLPEILAVAQRVLVVREGRVAADVPSDGLSEDALNLLVQGIAA